jgi:hypothetical protein
MKPEENEAVRTTIVGGRPPGCGRNNSAVPRGIEVLVKKSAVDAAFRERFLEVRDAAASEIGLELEPAEAAMLRCVPRQQLSQIIDHTDVPDEQRRAFLGKVAAIMLAALGVGASGCDMEEVGQPAGIQPDRPERTPSRTNTTSTAVSKGIRPEEVRPRASRTNTPSVSTTRGVQPDRPQNLTTLGVQPDRPQRP